MVNTLDNPNTEVLVSTKEASTPLVLKRIKARNYYRKNRTRIRMNRRKRYQRQKYLIQIKKDHTPKLKAITNGDHKMHHKGPIKDIYQGKSLKQLGLYKLHEHG